MNIGPRVTTGATPPPAETTAAQARPAASTGPKTAAASAARATPAAKATGSAPPNPADLRNSVEAINRFLKVNSEVQFSIDEASGYSVVKVIDAESHKVLRQFPSEQALEIGKDLQSFPKGLLVDNKA